MKKKPGVMIYLDMLPVVKQLSNEEKGILFESILEYAQDGTVRKLPPNLNILWPLIEAKLDNDELRYRQTIAKRGYGSYTRWAKQRGQEPVTYKDWVIAKGYAAYGVTEEEYLDS